MDQAVCPLRGLLPTGFEQGRRDHGLACFCHNGGALSDTIARSGGIPDQSTGCGVLAFQRAGIQNRAPDGPALINPSGGGIECLSHADVMTATSGAALADGNPANDAVVPGDLDGRPMPASGWNAPAASWPMT